MGVATTPKGKANDANHHYPARPLPVGAVTAEEWQPSGYRVFEGEERHIEDGVRVWTHGIQYQDGRIDGGTTAPSIEAPAIAVGGIYWEKNLSSDTARRLADLLVMAADEVDLWASPAERTELAP